MRAASGRAMLDDYGELMIMLWLLLNSGHPPLPDVAVAG